MRKRVLPELRKRVVRNVRTLRNVRTFGTSRTLMVFLGAHQLQVHRVSEVQMLVTS